MRVLISDDGLELHAYRVDGSVPHRYAVLCHGYQNNATGMASYGKHLFDLGYTVLLPDARGHGESEGDYIGMGVAGAPGCGPVVSTADRGGPGGGDRALRRLYGRCHRDDGLR